MTSIPKSPPAFLSLSRSQIIQLAAVGFQIIILLGLTQFLPPVVRPFLVVIALILIPGSLTAAMVYRGQALPLWQVVGFGVGLGLGEMLLWGRLLLTFGADSSALGYVLLGTTVLKMAWLWRQPFEMDFKPR